MVKLAEGYVVYIDSLAELPEAITAVKAQQMLRLPATWEVHWAALEGDGQSRVGFINLFAPKVKSARPVAGRPYPVQIFPLPLPMIYNAGYVNVELVDFDMIESQGPLVVLAPKATPLISVQALISAMAIDANIAIDRMDQDATNYIDAYATARLREFVLRWTKKPIVPSLEVDMALPKLLGPMMAKIILRRARNATQKR